MSARMSPPDTAMIRAYLLRTMTEADRSHFEDAYFHDDRLLDLVETEEDRLVADYVLGRLTESDRRRFEGSLLDSPYYKERVETTSRLHRSLARPELFHRPERAGRAPGTPMRAARREPRDGDRLFPGRSGSIVAFSALALLLVAAVLSALRLRSQLLDARRAAGEAPAAAAMTGSGGVVPAAIPVVLEASGTSGPAARRVRRPAGGALLLAVPRRLLPSAGQTWRVTFSDDTGRVVWDSGGLPVPAGDTARDLAMRLPAGVPPAGRLAVAISTDGAPPAILLALDLEDAAADGTFSAKPR